MNLTEKIIKGISEVEYEINPELLKDQPKKRPYDMLKHGLLSMGWNERVLQVQSGSVLSTKFTHSDTNEVLSVRYDVNDGLILSALLMEPGKQSNILTRQVDNILKFAKQSISVGGEIGAKEEDFVLDDDLVEQMKSQGWINVMNDWDVDIDFDNPIVLMVDHDDSPTRLDVEDLLGVLHADSMWAQSSNGFWVWPVYGQTRGDFMSEVEQLLAVLGV